MSTDLPVATNAAAGIQAKTMYHLPAVVAHKLGALCITIGVLELLGNTRVPWAPGTDSSIEFCFLSDVTTPVSLEASLNVTLRPS